MRDSFIFYKTFYECIKELPKESGYMLYHAIFEYVFDGTEPNLSGLERGIFALMRAQIDANNKKYENGKLGGRPKKEIDDFENEKRNQNQTKTNGSEEKKEIKNQKETNGFENCQKNENQTKTETKPNVNDNDNVNDNKNDNVNDNDNVFNYKNTHTKCTRFDEFYKIYPRKMDILNAQGEYIRLLETTPSLSEEDLIVAAQNYAKTCQIRNTKEQYIKSPVNWLRESSWLDYLPGVYKKPQKIEKPKAVIKNQFNNIGSRITITDEFERSLLG